MDGVENEIPIPWQEKLDNGVKRWEGRVAVVTGASSPIGRAICEDLVKHGLIVCGLATRSGKHELEDLGKKLERQQEKGKLLAFECDIKEEGHIQPIFRYIEDHYDGIDLLVNNANVMCKGLILDEDNTPLMRDVMETNIIGMCIVTREAARLMKMRKEERKNLGHVVNILSIVGHKFGPSNSRSKPINGLYPASRHAATAITECIRQEFLFLYENVKITAISPGLVEGQDTDILTEEERAHGKMPALEPKDVSAAVLYAISVKDTVQIHEIKIKPVGEFI
ncbi:hypothetical protein PVAND_005158 [Polypedilum vanderplanki]|uniref:Uncharacterized protein n=1 Tax=Polypedilum vanderplanki TaxID=319348 RepID=A0A9J6C074_POLVA|nr:hypothetical protein PVAND_005158 [Polypedilum vanderplanki]